MSYIRDIGIRPGNAGYFLESEVGLVRKTRQISAEDAVDVKGEKYVLAGSLWQKGDEVGIVYEDVCVSSGDMPGSVVLAGRVYGDIIPEETKAAIEKKAAFTVIEGYPETERPY